MKGQADRIIPDFSVENLKDLEGYSINSERPQMPELYPVKPSIMIYGEKHFTIKINLSISYPPIL